MVHVTFAAGWLPQDLLYSEYVIVHILAHKCHIHAGSFVVFSATILDGTIQVMSCPGQGTPAKGCPLKQYMAHHAVSCLLHMQ